jgi:large subunit ribosomal protein L22
VSAEKGLDVDVDRLFVKRAIANDGPRMKRIRPAPMGRAYRYQRRISHIEIALAEKAAGNGKGDLATKAVRKRAKKATAKKARRRRRRRSRRARLRRPAKKLQRKK